MCRRRTPIKQAHRGELKRSGAESRHRGAAREGPPQRRRQGVARSRHRRRRAGHDDQIGGVEAAQIVGRRDREPGRRAQRPDLLGARRWPNPNRREWRAGAIQGLLLPAAGTGGAAWSEQWLPSGVTALFLATIPLWIVVGRRFTDGERIRWPVAAGLAVGLAGVAVLTRPSGSGDLIAIAVALAGAMCWGLGSVYAMHAPRPQHALTASAIEMICAGGILAALALVTGEPSRIHFEPQSVLALAYLVIFGSIVAYSAYTWLLDHVAPRIVGTYAFVNPVVAVLLGWWILNEPLGVRVLAATALIAVGVALIVAAPAPARLPESDLDTAGKQRVV
jgi:drug/metabolite transporter (DMT)-like permease